MGGQSRTEVNLQRLLRHCEAMVTEAQHKETKVNWTGNWLNGTWYVKINSKIVYIGVFVLLEASIDQRKSIGLVKPW